jgi:ABC-type nitrate/sulfonate/bicarbonate transport system substrate-binding protein
MLLDFKWCHNVNSSSEAKLTALMFHRSLHGLETACRVIAKRKKENREEMQMAGQYKPSRRKVLGAGAGALAAFTVNRPAQAQSVKDVTITLSSNSFSTVALRFAERRGLFAKYNLNARLITMDSASVSFAAMLSGSAQLGIGGAGEALSATARGQEVIAVTNLYRGLSSVIVLARSAAEKSGVKIDGPLEDRLKALDGIVIAAASPTAVFGISLILAAQSVGSKPKMTYIGNPAMAPALESGAIQGFVSGTPYWVPPVLRGFGVAWIKPASGELPSQFSPTSSGTLMMTKAYARANPDVMRNIQSVIKDVGTFVANNKEAAMKELASIYPELDSQTISLGFNNEWQNWTKSVVTEDDIRHDIAFLKAAGQPIAGLEAIDPKSLVAI